ncbi:variable surface lipoprotein [Mycoplasmopsis agalactiae]|uniref:variable surface lipoprotein n=1 Tax=Mycoplasmopsis agalactiae TaxID=2110 RepID=UPI001F15FA50|nr:variable surface lipoprotein [Mycoplasmopsis agalactiae]
MKIKKLLLIAPFASASIAFVAASCDKGDSAVPEIINTGASGIEISTDEKTETNSASTVENSGSTGESSTIENNTNSTTSNDDNNQEAPKNNDLNTQTSPNTDEMEIVDTYKLNNINDMPPRDEPSIKENIVEVPSITPEEAKKLRKKLEDI